MWRNGNASPCHGEDPGPIPGIRSQALLGQLAEPLPSGGRRSEFESRVGHRLLRGITTAPVCAYRAVRMSPPRANMEGEPDRRCRARPLSDARVTPWLSNSPPSSVLEDEPAGPAGPRWNRGGGECRGIRVLRPLPSPACSQRAGDPLWRVNPPGPRALPRKRLSVRVAVRVRRSPRWKVRSTGLAFRSESRGTHAASRMPPELSFCIVTTGGPIG